jgi:hypothetical protein
MEYFQTSTTSSGRAATSAARCSLVNSERHMRLRMEKVQFRRVDRHIDRLACLDRTDSLEPRNGVGGPAQVLNGIGVA